MPVFKKQDQSLLQQVMGMRAQGMTDNQIIQTLQQQNFPAHQIFDALSQADLKAPASPVGSYPPTPQPRVNISGQQFPEAPRIEVSYAETPEQQQQTESLSVERIEEMIDAIVEDRWEEISKNIQKVIQWKDSTETRLVHIEDDIKELKNSIAELRQGIIGKVSEYDQSITRVGSQLKAMENVFKDILPTLTENVSELSRLTEKVKKTSETSYEPVKKTSKKDQIFD
ncbi:MAG: hypothetical protein QW331_00215 [Candidatus Woesearchaeota archaeon]